MYCINPKYWNTLEHYHICPQIWTSPFYYLSMYMYLKTAGLSGKQQNAASDLGLNWLLRPACLNTKGLLWYFDLIL